MSFVDPLLCSTLFVPQLNNRQPRAMLGTISATPAGQTVQLDYSKSDAFAVGWVCFELCSGGRPPYPENPPPPGTIGPQALPAGKYSKGLQEVLQGLLEADASMRLSAKDAYEKVMMLQYA